ncbi:MAG: S-methyl-5-thioribose-1-phosphate isomerase [Elusimicrobiota bacterium]
MSSRARSIPSRMRDKYRPIYRAGGTIMVLDQVVLPHRVVYQRIRTPKAMATATRDLVLRGAPLIGCAAAYGYALGAADAKRATPGVWRRLREAEKVLLAARPTAVNLKHAVQRMRRKAEALAAAGTSRLGFELMAEADTVTREDIETNWRMAQVGAPLLPRDGKIMTICNAGALATAGIGTAVGVIHWAHRSRGLRHVYACETRPFLQGARLTMWELLQYRIPSSLITDNMAAHIMKTEGINAVVAGADRVAGNGDAANKIGTYGLAILAREHGIPFYIVAPSTTVDLAIPSGEHIPIEERSSDEVTVIAGKSFAPKGTKARYPAFDVTPRRYITALVTEKGVVKPPGTRLLRSVLAS